MHLFLLHPSPVLWARVAEAIEDRPRVVAPPATIRRPTLPRNLLLASWGQDAREMQLVLAAGGGRVVDDHAAGGRPGDHPAAAHPGRRARRPAASRAAGPGRRGPGPARPGDHSLQVHACHGRARQVEVVRDAILHLLADDPTSKPATSSSCAPTSRRSRR